MLFALNMVYFQPAMASSPIDQTVIFYEEEKSGENGSDEDEGATEEDCE
jgi:hypothetical protein